METGHWNDDIIPWTSNVHYYIADHEWKASCSVSVFLFVILSLFLHIFHSAYTQCGVFPFRQVFVNFLFVIKYPYLSEFKNVQCYKWL